MIPQEGVKAKVMGNRMGLSHADVQHLAYMYGCDEWVDTLCPTDACTLKNCTCPQTMQSIGNAVYPIFKSTVDGCSRCVRHCPDTGGTDCSCHSGCTSVT